MKRAIVIVLDGCGAGAAPDAADFNDPNNPSTIAHVWEAVGGFHAPTLASIGFQSACGIKSIKDEFLPGASFGRLKPLSKAGKDSVTGHWEMTGIRFDKPFPTFPDGFPPELVRQLEIRCGCAFLGNRAASGTAIIAELGAEHIATGKPILYTSADSVLQIAAHEGTLPLDRLYEICEAARDVWTGEFAVQRVIARPFVGLPGDFTRTERRRDYPLSPPQNLCDRIGDIYGIGVVPELFSHRGFRDLPRTQSNAEHEVALMEAIEADARFIFANFEDFDMLYGHRNDAQGFAKCLETFDRTLAKVLERLTDDDLLIITADHGNDPTDASTDHSREYVPACIYSKSDRGGRFEDVDGFSAVGATVAGHLGVSWGEGITLVSSRT